MPGHSSGEGGIRTFIYTDRPVYRPGDIVYFKGIVRNYKKQRLSDSHRIRNGESTDRGREYCGVRH